MEIIDSHVHVGLNRFFTGKGVSRFPFDLENQFQAYYRILRNAKIDKACILPIPAKDFDTTLSHRYLEEAAVYSEGAFLPVCRLDAALANHLCGNFVAGKLHRVYDDLPPKSLHLYLKMLAYYKRPLILHAQFKNKVKQVKDFLKIAPRLVIVLAHMGRGHIYTSEQVVENLVGLAEEKNVFFET